MMRENPRVCFEVDRLRDHTSWQSAIVHGVFEELNGDQRRLRYTSCSNDCAALARVKVRWRPMAPVGQLRTAAKKWARAKK